MRRLLVAAVSVGEGLRWVANSPICLPACPGDADPQVMEYAGRLKQLHAVERRLNALSRGPRMTTTVPDEPDLPEHWCCAILENMYLSECCSQIMATLKSNWGRAENLITADT